MNYIDITQTPYNAVLDNVTDNTAAFEAAIAALPDGGVIYVPGPARVSQTLMIGSAIIFAGNGLDVSAISAIGDVCVAHFLPTVSGGGMHDISVYGYQNVAATTNALQIQDNAFVNLRDMRVWGGFSGLYDAGCDGIRENVFFSGFNPSGSCVTSNGANWWLRCKFDTIPGLPLTWGFLQGTPNPGQTTSENRFSQCDFSGSFAYSVQIADGGANAADMVFDSCLFSSLVLYNTGMWACFKGCKFGALVDRGYCPITFSDCYAWVPFVTSGLPTVHISNNIGIT